MDTVFLIVEGQGYDPYFFLYATLDEQDARRKMRELYDRDKKHKLPHNFYLLALKVGVELDMFNFPSIARLP